MKKIVFLILIALQNFLHANHQGQILATQLTQCSISEVYFTLEDKAKLSSGNIPYGCKVYLYILGLNGFKEVDSKIDASGSLRIFNSKNQLIFKQDSIFTEALDADAFKSQLFVHFQCQNPLRAEREYRFQYTIEDKNGKSKLVVVKNFTLDFQEGLTIESNGLTSDGPFICINKEVSSVLSNSFDPGTDVQCYLTGFKGAVEKDSTVSIDASMVLYSKKGKVLQEFQNLFGDNPVNAKDANELLNFTLTLPADFPPGKYKVIYTIRDRKSDKKMSATYLFSVKKPK